MKKHIPGIAVVSPTAAAARAFAPRLAGLLPRDELVVYSLDGFLSDRRAPSRIVICPAGRSVREDVLFLGDVRRRALWPRPASELGGAIAGLRGEHDAPPAGSAALRSGRGRTTALLLEGDVTQARAASAVRSGGPRHWIVERVQRVRIPPAALEELRRIGIRWSALEPIEVISLAASPDLASDPTRWASRLPGGVPVWRILPADPSPRRRRKQ